MVVILEYCNDVISGKEAAGQLLKLSCNRFVKDLERDDIYFDEKYFTQIVVFFSLLRHWQGKWAGTPIVLTPFQKFMIGGLMCFRWTAT